MFQMGYPNHTWTQNQNTTWTMTICNDFFLLCKTFPQPPSPNALSFVVFTKVQMLNKNTQSPFHSTFGFVFLSSLLPLCLLLFYACLGCPFLLPSYYLFSSPFNNKTWFKVEFTLKVVKFSFTPLIPNDCLPMYIQVIPQNCPLYFPHNFYNVKVQIP
jgi:hypothetical protein